jgi:K+-transporting ATPase ATPase B chain
VALLTTLIGLLHTRLSAPRLAPIYLSAVLPAAAMWGCLGRRVNLLLYELGRLIMPFVGIKLIDLVVHNLLGA